MDSRERREQFDFHMELEDIGFYESRALALAALRLSLHESDMSATKPIDTAALKNALNDDAN